MTIRNFRWEDAPSLAELENRLLQSPHASTAPKERFVTEFLGQPNLNPEEDLFLYESEGILQGYGLIFHEPAISRTVLMSKTHPNADASTVEEALLDTALRRGGQLGANVLHVQAKPNSPQSDLLLRRDFQHIRTYWTMGWEIQDLPPADPRRAAPSGVTAGKATQRRSRTSRTPPLAAAGDLPQHPPGNCLSRRNERHQPRRDNLPLRG